MLLNTLLDAKLIYHTDTVIQFLFDLFLPKVYRDPPNLFKQDIVSPVSRDIFFDFLYPILTIGFEFEFPVFPIVPMPKLTIDKNSNPIFGSYYVRRPRKGFVVFAISVSFMP